MQPLESLQLLAEVRFFYFINLSSSYMWESWPKVGQAEHATYIFTIAQGEEIFLQVVFSPQELHEKKV